MPSPEETIESVSTIESELYFLIARFLSSGPCKKASDVLLEELGKNKVELYPHISSHHLLGICQRLGPLLDKEVPPSITGVPSLLGAGSLSLLRTVETSKKTKWSPSQVVVTHHGNPLLPPRNIATIPTGYLLKGREMSGQSRPDLVFPCQHYSHLSLYDRKLGHLSAVYCISFDRTGQYIITGADDGLVKLWCSMDGRLIATLRGHSAEITDIAINFENTLLATGSCDKIIRVWCLRTKAPVAVLTGHTGMITSVQFCPQVKRDTRYLGTTGADGCVCFWQWNVNTLKFNSKPIKFVERSRAGAQMLCSSFSPGGLFLATGNSDNVIRVYFFHATAPEKICELEAHKDRVDSITYSNQGMRFVSGSKDGTARIWRYERQEWKAVVLNMSSKLPSIVKTEADQTSTTDESKKDKLRVTMVAWTMDDEQVITAVSDFTLKVWDSHTGKLLHVLQSHKDEVFVLEPSPMDARILLSAGHDGNVVVWDLYTGSKIKSFFNMIEGQGHGAVFDCKFSPEGLGFAAVDSHGHLLMFGFGSNEKFLKVPKEVFFHTDYRPLIRDANNYVLDEQTQQAPHLMPPPFLVDIDGNPYPPRIQRLVPGREHCKDEVLIPEVAINEEGSSEVIGDGEMGPPPVVEAPVPPLVVEAPVPPLVVEAPVPPPVVEAPVPPLVVEAPVPPLVVEAPVPPLVVEAPAPPPVPASIERNRDSLDVRIEQLQREQDQRIAREGGEPLASPPPVGSPPSFLSPRSRNNQAGRIGMRRSGETEGVRQSLSNVRVRASKGAIAALRRRVVVPPVDLEVLWRSEEKRMTYADEEFRKFVFEKKKKPISPHGPQSHAAGAKTKTKQASTTNQQPPAENEETARNRLITRALYDTEEEDEDGNSSASDFLHESDTDEYSDWMGDTGSNLQPPTRTSKRQRKRKRFSSTDELDDDDEDDDTANANEKDDSGSGSNVERKPKKTKPPPKKKTKQTKSQRKEIPTAVTELSEAFRPPEWLTDTIPRKTPFVPQMGDEVMYFRQGHELYLTAVKRHKVYDVNPNNNQPWHKIPNLREQELVKIVGIKYEIRPPRLCCLKLAFIDNDTGKPTGGSFSIKYHDMPDVIDFLVLKQTYNIAMQRKWKPSDRFRSMIDDHWWMGKIESQEPFQQEFSDSMYQCFNVRWDNGEFEKLSPWDLEPIGNDCLPNDVGGGVIVKKEELKSLLYIPTRGEWLSGDREEESERIIHGLEAIMQHSIAESFNAPVDLNAFPVYAQIIEYPIDLSTVKSRLENRFYRRVNAVQFDIRHIESNTAKFNEPGSAIVSKAAIITDTLLKFISDTDCFDPVTILHELMQKKKLYNSATEVGDSSDEASPGKRKRSDKERSGKRLCGGKPPDPNAWKQQCAEFIRRIMECEDTEPFRRAVDPDMYPDYYKFVENPMDFSQIMEKVNNEQYANPMELCRDIRLIFNNSKSYNTNKRSRIYAMTLRLSAMFEDQIKEIVLDWKLTSKNKPVAKSASSGKSTKPTLKVSPSTASTSRRDRVTTASSDSSQPSSSSGSTPVRVTRSQGVNERSMDGYSSGPSGTSRPRRAVQASRDRAQKAIGSDGESEEEEEDESENEETEIEGDKEENDSTPVTRRSKRRPVRNKIRSDDEESEEERPRGKAFPKRNSRLPDKSAVSNGHSKTSYRTRTSTGKVKPAKYLQDESSSLVSKSESTSGTSSSSSSSRESGSSSENESEDREDVKQEQSDHEEERPSLRRNASKSNARSIQKQVESVRHSARERRKVQDSMFVYEHKPKSRIKTRNQGRRTVQYMEDESDNEHANGRTKNLKNHHDSDSESDSESDTNSHSNDRSSPEVVSTSSRGRLRKLTPRAKASLLGD